MADAQSRFFVVANRDGFYQGTIQLPDGTNYTGRIYPNDGPRGTWYRADLIASDNAVFNADTKIDPAKRPDELPPESTLRPCELRLNYFRDGEDKERKPMLKGNGEPVKQYIATLWTSRGLHTIFAEETVQDGRAALRGRIVPYERRAELEAGAEPDGEAARANAGKRAGKGQEPKAAANEQA
jgi:hypothetical protein